MNRDKASAAAILLGAVAFIVTMGLHPTGGDLEYLRKIAAVVVGVHSLAIVSLALVTLGFLGLTARLRESAFAPAGMVAYAFGAVAAMCAGVLNGLALPALARHHAGSDEATLETLRVIVGYNHALNASFARVFMVATVVATLLWSIAILRTRALPRWTGVVGAVAGGGALALLLSGGVGVDVHDFSLFVFAYSAWTILIGITLWRRSAGSSTAGPRPAGPPTA